MNKDGRRIEGSGAGICSYRRYRIGNAQSIGSYQIQSNYFSTRNEEFALAVLADGTVDHINGRRCAVLAVEACMRELQFSLPDENFYFLFEYIAAKVLEEVREVIYRGRTPYLSLSIIYIKDRQLFYYNVGTNQVFLFNGRDYQFIRGRSGFLHFGGGMTAGMISRGVSEALSEKEMISCLEDRRHPFDKAQRMAAAVREKNRKRAGNATVVLIEDSL